MISDTSIWLFKLLFEDAANIAIILGHSLLDFCKNPKLDVPKLINGDTDNTSLIFMQEHKFSTQVKLTRSFHGGSIFVLDTDVKEEQVISF